MDEHFCVSPSNCAVPGSALHAGDQAEERAEEGDVGRGPGETRRGGGMDFGSEGRVGCLRGKEGALPRGRNSTNAGMGAGKDGFGGK